jgi:hypothetical protein
LGDDEAAPAARGAAHEEQQLVGRVLPGQEHTPSAVGREMDVVVALVARRSSLVAFA